MKDIAWAGICVAAVIVACVPVGLMFALILGTSPWRGIELVLTGMSGLGLFCAVGYGALWIVNRVFRRSSSL